MRELDRMLIKAKKLEVLTQPYLRVCFLEPDKDGIWGIRGTDRTYNTEHQAKQFCQKQATGREVTIIINDIPRPDPGETGHDIASFSTYKRHMEGEKS